MTLIVVEVTGEAGYMTRVEAFLDMLQSRKRSLEVKKRALLKQ
jgi:predicted nucleotide-binding protein (sugar kinase/HSP70/actin superfamily)